MCDAVRAEDFVRCLANDKVESAILEWDRSLAAWRLIEARA